MRGEKWLVATNKLRALSTKGKKRRPRYLSETEDPGYPISNTHCHPEMYRKEVSDNRKIYRSTVILTTVKTLIYKYIFPLAKCRITILLATKTPIAGGSSLPTLVLKNQAILFLLVVYSDTLPLCFFGTPASNLAYS
jgi:hypothetical protein